MRFPSISYNDAASQRQLAALKYLPSSLERVLDNERQLMAPIKLAQKNGSHTNGGNFLVAAGSLEIKQSCHLLVLVSVAHQ